MKKTKLLSVLLAVVMIITSFAAAFPVFAANNVDNVKSIIDKFDGNMTVSDPSEEDLKAYNEMIAAYNALSDNEISNFDVVLFSKLINVVYDREIAL